MTTNKKSTKTQAEKSKIKPAEFVTFTGENQKAENPNQNLDLLMDVNLQLTAELGRAELPVKKVLELTKGSILQLDKAAGEPVALFANGKHIADGEVVVIEDNFGIKITNIVSESIGK